jgi:nitroreductase
MTAISPTWYPAINVRRSSRTYDKSKTIATEVKNKLHEACSGFRPYGSVRVEFISEPPDDVFANALGFYGNIKGAPAFFAFVGDMSDPNVQEKMGYTGEAAVLEATSLGLGTCWVALTYNAKAVKSLVKLGSNEKLICVSPVGYTTESWSFEEKALRGFGANHQRKPLQSMAGGLAEPGWPDWAKAAAEAARLAPSAMNRQPWSFHIEKDSITIAVKNQGIEFNVAKRLDCGIAMLHIELGALSKGARGHWELLKQPQVARFTLE